MDAKRYHLRMPSLRVRIVRFVDEEPQPGVVESRFRDAHGLVHTIIDKVPLFTNAALWSDSEYPQPGFVGCKVLQRMCDSNGLNLARITISEPWCVETTDGKSEFVIVRPHDVPSPGDQSKHPHYSSGTCQHSQPLNWA